mgnify:CR=1 FL=1
MVITAVVTSTAMDLPTLSMIAQMAVNLGEIQSVAQTLMVMGGPTKVMIFLMSQLNGQMQTSTDLVIIQPLQ